MNRMLIGCWYAVVVGCLAGCGAETAATAASGAVIKQQELEQARSAKQATEQQIQQAADQMQQRADQLKQATQ